MYANLRKEVLDAEGKVTFRKTFSIDMETPGMEKSATDNVIQHFIKQGYVVDSCTKERLYK